MFRVVDQFYFHDHGTHAEANRYVTTTNAIWIGDIKKSFQLKRHRLFKNQMGRLQLARLSHAAAAATAMVMMMMTLRSEIVHSQLILNADGPWADKLWQMYATHRHTHDHVYNSSSAPLSVVLYFYFFFSFSFVLYVIHLSVHDSCVAGIALLMLFFSIRPFHFALNNNGHIYAFRYECVCIVFFFYIRVHSPKNTENSSIIILDVALWHAMPKRPQTLPFTKILLIETEKKKTHKHTWQSLSSSLRCDDLILKFSIHNLVDCL